MGVNSTGSFTGKKARGAPSPRPPPSPPPGRRSVHRGVVETSRGVRGTPGMGKNMWVHDGGPRGGKAGGLGPIKDARGLDELRAELLRKKSRLDYLLRNGAQVGVSHRRPRGGNRPERRRCSTLAAVRAPPSMSQGPPVLAPLRERVFRRRASARALDGTAPFFFPPPQGERSSHPAKSLSRHLASRRL